MVLDSENTEIGNVGWMLFALFALGEGVAYLVFETHLLAELATYNDAGAAIVAVLVIVGAFLKIWSKAKGATGI